jgi:hypothetical protein
VLGHSSNVEENSSVVGTYEDADDNDIDQCCLNKDRMR